MCYATRFETVQRTKAKEQSYISEFHYKAFRNEFFNADLAGFWQEKRERSFFREHGSESAVVFLSDINALLVA